MRRFSSYGPVNDKLHYYVPRNELIEKGYSQLVGEPPEEGGHYFTVWAPRQTGKSTLMKDILLRLKKDSRFDTLVINLENFKYETNSIRMMNQIAIKIGEGLGKPVFEITSTDQFQEIFRKNILDKPLILILDEFDALDESIINALVSSLRSIYNIRQYESEKSANQKTYLLHSIALIGVRRVLGIENEKGSPFNVQRSLHISNLTFEEVKEMFAWYERESGQKIDEIVPRILYEETLGQPGLTCWFGELLTETYNTDPSKPITIEHFKEAYGAANYVLPNNNILNIISKVNKPPFNEMVMNLFETGEKMTFSFDDPEINNLYMNGVIVPDKAGYDEYYVKFSCPFVQNRIFSYFSRRFFNHLGQLLSPLDSMKDAITEDVLFIPNIIKRYREYLRKNRDMFFKEVPRRKTDLKIYEAVYHLNLYRYLFDLLKKRGVDVIPQFPTGNGKIDLILKYREKKYAIELKSFKDMYTFEKGIEQAAEYGKQLGLNEISYLVFVELSDEDIRQFEKHIERDGITVVILPISIL